MTIHFVHEMERLHRDILSMCSTVEELINDAVDGLKDGRSELAEELSARDHEVDRWDIRIEEECLKILALYHPVANDLRRVTVVMKITADLERVADLAVSIAERSACLAEFGKFPMPGRLGEMTREALSMLHDSIDAFVEQNAVAARRICERDDLVDRLNSELIKEVVDVMKERPDLIEPGLHLFSVIRHVERVADHATNIAEDVVYLVEGAIIRHARNHR
ncbi:MAG TPA: phosphate signaling complex protein PhoU [Planctomycetaceae bacterium]|nr:phosphate signaling complex protein PhoU [Planctomycetaceae bacterium]HQZ68628.1 phosphate signaling complex protein PhoU [Planctomycetaceae bacterium]HRA88477.1 phosphate signaling complex protein PhoU [Planctomycetaceae bacterium]